MAQRNPATRVILYGNAQSNSESGMQSLNANCFTSSTLSDVKESIVESDDVKEKQLAALIGDEPVKKAGRPQIKLAETFDGAMAALTPNDATLVRHMLAGMNATDAYRVLHPDAKRANVRASAIARKAEVAHAIALGKKAGALAAISGIKYDIAAAHDEINEHIATAVRQEQMNAVASLLREKLKIHHLVDQGPQVAAGASFTLIIRGQDGEERTVNPSHVIDIQPTQKEEV